LKSYFRRRDHQLQPSLLVLGIMRPATLGIYLRRKRRKNQRQSTVKDFHDAMNRFNSRIAFVTITAH